MSGDLAVFEPRRKADAEGLDFCEKVPRGLFCWRGQWRFVTDFDSAKIMKIISSVIRIVAGSVISILAVMTHRRTASAMEEGGSAVIFGNEVGASAGQLGFGFVVLGLIGIAMVALGVYGFIKSKG